MTFLLKEKRNELCQSESSRVETTDVEVPVGIATSLASRLSRVNVQAASLQ
jgi:hypothetical protein